MTFATPLAFLLFLPWCLAAWRLFRPATRRRGIPFAPLSRIPRRRSLRQRLRFLPPVLLLLGLATAIVAAARPQTRLRNITHSSDAIAIEMILDLSGSMMNRDMVSSDAKDAIARIDSAKEAFREFVNRRPADLVGLVAFGAWAETRVPLTLDHASLLHVLDHRISIQENAFASRTALGDGLALGCARLDIATNVASHVAVLLTDGQNNSGEVDPLQAASAAKALGVRVYTIGIGDREPVRDIFGRVQYHDAVDVKTLTAMAEATGGRFFRARDAKALDEAMEEIDRMEKTSIDELRLESRVEEYAPWLAAACALLLASFALGLLLEHRIA